MIYNLKKFLLKNKSELDQLCLQHSNDIFVDKVKKLIMILDEYSTREKRTSEEQELVASFYLDLQSFFLINDQKERLEFFNDVFKKISRLQLIDDVVELYFEKLKLDEKITGVREHEPSITDLRKQYALLDDISLEKTRKNFESNMQYHKEAFAGSTLLFSKKDMHTEQEQHHMLHM